MRRALVVLGAAVASSLVALSAAADDGGAPAQDAQAAQAPPATPDAQAPESVHGCVPSLAKGASRPVVTEDFPHRGTSGWIATLTLTLRHGKGEHVLPSGFRLQQGGDADKELRAAGFAFPEQDAGTGAAKLTELAEDPAHPEIATTVLEVPLVLLPEKPGRSALTLPPLPVAVARANGDVSTVCTRPHLITVEDPIADTPEPTPRGNPPPRVQREEWKEAKIAAAILGGALVIGLVLGLLLRQWKRRPKPVPPPPPPRPAWEIALEKLHDARHAGLLDAGRADELCDRVSDALREYVGKTLGFDGLERTTDEIGIELSRSAMADVERKAVLDVLRECDLVKFAKFVPEPAACLGLLDTAEQHVKRTMPRRGAPPPKRRDDRDDRDDDESLRDAPAPAPESQRDAPKAVDSETDTGTSAAPRAEAAEGTEGPEGSAGPAPTKPNDDEEAP